MYAYMYIHIYTNMYTYISLIIIKVNISLKLFYEGAAKLRWSVVSKLLSISHSMS